METNRLEQQLSFLIECDKMKKILRHTVLMDGSRRETDAEHSWHFALMAMTLLDTLKIKTWILIRFSGWPWCTI